MYSSLKILHHQDQIARMRRGGRPDLLHVYLVPTNRCNHNCQFCAYRSHGYSSSEDFAAQDEIPFAKLTEIVDSCVALGTQAIEMTGGGEPTKHPDFPRLCKYIREAGLQYAIVTNASIMTPAIREAFLGATWIRCSVDAATDATYRSIRRTTDTLGQTRENIRSIISARRGRDPVVGVGFVVTADNWSETLDVVANAKEDGVDNVRISGVFQNDGVEYFREFHGETRDLCEEAKALTTARFRVFDLFGERLNDLQQESPNYSRCWFHEVSTYVAADLNVYDCCVVAYNQLGLIGSIREQSLKDLWTAPETHDRLRTYDARQCPRCMYNGKNQAISYMMHPNPPHVAFI